MSEELFKSINDLVTHVSATKYSEPWEYSDCDVLDKTKLINKRITILGVKERMHERGTIYWAIAVRTDDGRTGVVTDSCARFGAILGYVNEVQPTWFPKTGTLRLSNKTGYYLLDY